MGITLTRRQEVDYNDTVRRILMAREVIAQPKRIRRTPEEIERQPRVVLTDKMRRAIYAKHQFGMPTLEIGKAMGLHQATVAKVIRLHREAKK